jgi:16S rRNA (guanine527-N7)-methyltransferase
MDGIDLINRHFPGLSSQQQERFSKLGDLYREWNAQINVISRKDIDQLYTNHVLHSLAIAKVMPFAPGSKILDVGTGGGFPGIPLAILYPDCHFRMIDSIGKKIKVVNAVIEALGLENAEAQQLRAEQDRGKYDFVVSRAVTRLEKFVPWVQQRFRKQQINPFPNGILYLKGGDLREELKAVRRDTDVVQLTQFFDEPFFETKAVVYVRMVE